MIKTKTTIYHCSYCRRYYLSSSNCKRHEKVCFRNPENKCCWTCKHGGKWAANCDKLGIDFSEVTTPIRNCKNWEQSTESILESLENVEK